MAPLDITLSIAAIIALLSLAAMGIYATRALRRIADLMIDVHTTVDETKRLAAELNKNLPQTFVAVQAVSEQTITTLQNVDVQLTTLGEGIGEFKAIGVRINSLEAKLQDKIEAPLMQAASVVAGLSKAINTFVNGVRR